MDISTVQNDAMKLVEALRARGEDATVDIGASIRRRAAITLDLYKFEGVDIAWDITDGLPFDDDSLDGILMFHVVEHLPVQAFEPLFLEIWRVCRPGARVHIKTPHFSCGLMAWSDPTHIRPFALRTFTEYLTNSEKMHFNSLFPVLPAYGVETASLHYYGFRKGRAVRLGLFGKFIDYIANLTPWIQRQFERRLAYLFGGFEEIDAVLVVRK